MFPYVYLAGTSEHHQIQYLKFHFLTANTLRKIQFHLHFQKQFPQGKLVRVIKGVVFDVAVDLRQESKTYGEWFGIELSDENKKQFYIPEGFAHGFLVLSDTAEFCYKCTDFYHPGDEGGLLWNDPDIGIEWPISADMNVLLSDKDSKQPLFKDLR